MLENPAVFSGIYDLFNRLLLKFPPQDLGPILSKLFALHIQSDPDH